MLRYGNKFFVFKVYWPIEHGRRVYWKMPKRVVFYLRSSK